MFVERPELVASSKMAIFLASLTAGVAGYLWFHDCESPWRFSKSNGDASVRRGWFGGPMAVWMPRHGDIADLPAIRRPRRKQ